MIDLKFMSYWDTPDTDSINCHVFLRVVTSVNITCRDEVLYFSTRRETDLDDPGSPVSVIDTLMRSPKCSYKSHL